MTRWLHDLAHAAERRSLLAAHFGYWLRPYDMLADRRRWRWRWQERHPCQTVDGLPAVLRRWETDR